MIQPHEPIGSPPRPPLSSFRYTARNPTRIGSMDRSGRCVFASRPAYRRTELRHAICMKTTA